MIDTEFLRYILLVIFLPIAGYKIYGFYKKLFFLLEPSIRKQLEKIFNSSH